MIIWPDLDQATENELHKLENMCHDVRRAKLHTRMRQLQIAEVDRDPSATFQWLGEIGTFCEDLCFHAKRLNRNITGKFNGTEIIAYPDSSPKDLTRLYFALRK